MKKSGAGLKFARRLFELCIQATATPAVLIVEDDPVIRRLLGAAVAREPLHVDMACDGLEALERMVARDYEVLLIDLMMPRMSGFELLERIAHSSKRRLVFVLTAYDRAMTLGLDRRVVHAIVRKPFDLESLVEIVRECAVALASSAPARESHRPPLDERSELAT